MLLSPFATLIAMEFHSVSALGRLEPKGGIIRIAAPSTSKSISGSILAQLFVKEGDYVKKGDVLAETDSKSLLEVGLKRANNELELSILSAKVIKNQTEEACVNAKFAKSESKRMKSLLKRKLASKKDAEQADSIFQAKTALCLAAKANHLVAVSKINIERTKVEINKVELQRSIITAPFDSRVIDILIQPGELVGPKGILELGRVQHMYAIAEVYESDIGKVKIGQRAKVMSVVLEEPLYGRVEFIHLKVAKQDVIDTDPAARKDARIIEVDILLDNSKAAADLTYLQVEIVIEN